MNNEVTRMSETPSMESRGRSRSAERRRGRRRTTMTTEEEEGEGGKASGVSATPTRGGLCSVSDQTIEKESRKTWRSSD